jgi:hypothetical protein
VGDRIRELADAAGMHYGDYIAALCAEKVGMPDLAPQPADRSSEVELPIAAA